MLLIRLRWQFKFFLCFRPSPPPSSSSFWQVPNTAAAASNHRRLNRGLLPTQRGCAPPHIWADVLICCCRRRVLRCCCCCWLVVRNVVWPLLEDGGRRTEEEEEQAASILKDETRSQLRITNTTHQDREEVCYFRSIVTYHTFFGPDNKRSKKKRLPPQKATYSLGRVFSTKDVRRRRRRQGILKLWGHTLLFPR